MSRRLGWLIALVVVALVAAACSNGGGNGDQAATEGGTDNGAEGGGDEGAEEGDVEPGSGRLTIAYNGLEPRANWGLETDDATLLVKLGVLETLVLVTFDGELEPGLAESWEQVDEVTWAFTLRDDVRFHDGEPLTAAAVATALESVTSTATPPRALPEGLIDRFEADGDLRLVVHTAEPDALLPLRFTAPGSGILSPNAYGGGETPDPFGTGTGPFVLVEEVRDQFLRLERNDDYWGGNVALAEVEARMVPDGGIRAGMVQSGEVDIAYDIPIPQLPVLETVPDVRLESRELARTQTLIFNNGSDVLADARVRQAILHAIDTQVIADSVLEGAASPAAGPFPHWQEWANDSLSPYEHDVARAQQLLADAGYEEGELSLTLTTYPERADLPDLAVAIQGMLSQVGVNVDTRVLEYAAVEPQLYDGDFDLFLLSRSQLFDMYDPIGYLDADYTCEGGYNLSHFCSEAVDAMIEEAANTADEAARWSLYSEASTILHEEAVNGFLVHPQQLAAVREDVRNFRIHPLDNRWLTTDLTAG
jgi:peptide/nickel transport system substrate-binding protein